MSGVLYMQSNPDWKTRSLDFHIKRDTTITSTAPQRF